MSRPMRRLAVSGSGYVVRLKDDPVASYTGGMKGLAPTSPAVTGRRLTRRAPATLA